MKIVCLGNEFIEGDSLAKKVGELLSGEFDVVNVKSSFDLMGVLACEDEFVLIDVVKGLSEVCWIGVSDLRVDSIVSAHDFDAGYVLGLLDVDVGIIGIPMSGDVFEVGSLVRELVRKRMGC